MEELVTALNLTTAILQGLTTATQGFITCCCGLPGFLIALGTVFFAYRATHETRQNTQAQIASDLLDAYASDEMREAKRDVAAYCETTPNFAQTFLTDTNARYSRFTEVDKGRRRLAHYYQKVAILSRNGLLDRRLLTEIISWDQVDFACRFLEPLEIALAVKLSGKYDSTDFDDVMRIHPSACKERAHPPAPAADSIPKRPISGSH